MPNVQKTCLNTLKRKFILEYLIEV